MAKAPPVFMKRPERKAWRPESKRDTNRIRGSMGQKLRKRRMERTNWLCEDCSAKGLVRAADVVDHIKPLALGGEDVDSNTRNLCNDCHKVRTKEQFGRNTPPPTKS
ncbi:HNH endonuclease [Candidatus Pacearchaeota archaeon]|nr:HNH endonuclease [Candidatus Pacearchaeota archaeon]